MATHWRSAPVSFLAYCRRKGTPATSRVVLTNCTSVCVQSDPLRAVGLARVARARHNNFRPHCGFRLDCLGHRDATAREMGTQLTRTDMGGRWQVCKRICPELLKRASAGDTQQYAKEEEQAQPPRHCSRNTAHRVDTPSVLSSRFFIGKSKRRSASFLLLPQDRSYVLYPSSGCRGKYGASFFFLQNLKRENERKQPQNMSRQTCSGIAQPHYTQCTPSVPV